MPDLLKTFVPDIDDEFITLLKEDQEIQTFLRDPGCTNFASGHSGN